MRRWRSPCENLRRVAAALRGEIPDTVDSCIGTLEFKERAPNQVTLEKVYDQLDFMHALRTFSDALQAAFLFGGLRDSENLTRKFADDHSRSFCVPLVEVDRFPAHRP